MSATCWLVSMCVTTRCVNKELTHSSLQNTVFSTITKIARKILARNLNQKFMKLKIFVSFCIKLGRMDSQACKRIRQHALPLKLHILQNRSSETVLTAVNQKEIWNSSCLIYSFPRWGSKCNEQNFIKRKEYETIKLVSQQLVNMMNLNLNHQSCRYTGSLFFRIWSDYQENLQCKRQNFKQRSQDGIYIYN